jgi:hypothetical protein
LTKLVNCFAEFWERKKKNSVEKQKMMAKRCERGGEEGGILQSAGSGEREGKPERRDTPPKNNAGVAEGFQPFAPVMPVSKW